MTTLKRISKCGASGRMNSSYLLCCPGLTNKWKMQRMLGMPVKRGLSSTFVCLRVVWCQRRKLFFFDFPDLLSDGPAIEFDRHHHPTKQSRREREKDKFWTAAWLTEAFFSETQQDFATNCS